jgi:hypothetical protein
MQQVSPLPRIDEKPHADLPKVARYASTYSCTILHATAAYALAVDLRMCRAGESALSSYNEIASSQANPGSGMRLVCGAWAPSG